MVTDPWEIEHIATLRLKRYPEYAALPPPVTQSGYAQRIAQHPAGDVVLLRVEPEIISVLDYSIAFGHSELVAFSARDLDQHIGSLHHRWDKPPRSASGGAS